MLSTYNSHCHENYGVVPQADWRAGPAAVTQPAGRPVPTDDEKCLEKKRQAALLQQKRLCKRPYQMTESQDKRNDDAEDFMHLAKLIGIEPDEPEFFWIAKEAYNSDLPVRWEGFL